MENQHTLVGLLGDSMKILKEPHMVKYYQKCSNCTCEFEYDARDICTLSLLPPESLKSDVHHFGHYYYINCPFCGTMLNHENSKKIK